MVQEQWVGNGRGPPKGAAGGLVLCPPRVGPRQLFDRPRADQPLIEMQRQAPGSQGSRCVGRGAGQQAPGPAALPRLGWGRSFPQGSWAGT